MGSKRAMLQNGLGHLLCREIDGCNRFFDLFAGAGFVATHVAQHYEVAVSAFDLQAYSAVITGAVLERTAALDALTIWDEWESRSCQKIRKDFPALGEFSTATVSAHREWCQQQSGFPITQAYGGHYFSAAQAVWLDALRSTLPACPIEGKATLAALIHAASQCVAAPGHTAQPFQPTDTAIPFLREAWQRNVVEKTKDGFAQIAKRHALVLGAVGQADANVVAQELKKGDLVFIDPPYSGVHYSRFYHVLETIADGECGEVSGVGRYPEPKLRPWSRYSVKREARKALDELLGIVANRGAKGVLTFPNHECSNGLSGQTVREIASKYFSVDEVLVKSRFSTLGGHKHDSDSKRGRIARHKADELILVLRP